MQRLLLPLIAIASLIVSATTMAQEPQRFALLIGNQKYDRSVGELKNPHNDIALVGTALKAQGFTVLPLVQDARRSAILGSVRGLVSRLNGAGQGAIGFIYYSGHGAAEKDTGINYLIPVDATEPGSSSFWDDSVKLDDVLRLLEGARSASKFVIFDACRNELQLSERTSDKGLIPVREHQGMFIAYSTAPGRVASDRGTTSGPYAAALATELGKPGLDHLNLFQNVKETVLASTNGVQQPWESNGLGRRVILAPQPKAAAAARVPEPTATTAANVGAADAAERTWGLIRESRNPSVLEAYVKQFPGTVHAALAQERLTDLQRETQIVKQKADQQRFGSVQKQTPDPKGEAAGDMPQVGQTFRDCHDGCPEMVVVPAGSFLMGSPSGEVRNKGYDGREEPQRPVTIRQPFAVGKFEVTFTEWDACVVGGGCASNKSPNDQGWGKGRRPVMNVSWNDAKEYAAWLSRKTGKSYRLLSEAEWEYAARGDTSSKFAFGETITKGQAQFQADKTIEAGSFQANKFGLHDMHGNVWEWVEDNWHLNYLGAPNDGSVWQGGDASLRVLRGGSWSFSPGFLRSAFRYRDPPGSRYDGIGFRLARKL